MLIKRLQGKIFLGLLFALEKVKMFQGIQKKKKEKEGITSNFFFKQILDRKRKTLILYTNFFDERSSNPTKEMN